jgi:hypothetical protein
MVKSTPLLGCLALLLVTGARTPAQDASTELVQKYQWDLSTDGKAFLLKEAGNASFFLVGGLHGDNETPALVEGVWPSLQASGYRHVVAEMSPWAASRLKVPHLRGGDIEEPRPHLIIGDLGAANPQNRSLQSMVQAVKDGYQRTLAPHLLQLAQQMGEVKDSMEGGVSLKSLVLRTLEVEAARANTDDRRHASVLRETVMKELFLTHYRAAGPKPKVMAVFGQSHMGRGIDRRGVSTLGNFIAELAIAENTQSFHVELFAAGGKISFGGLRDIDQRKDEQAFELLASMARYPATVFDLRPLRSQIRRSQVDKLSARDASLLYVADSYDAVVCYREVTPMDIQTK